MNSASMLFRRTLSIVLLLAAVVPQAFATDYPFVSGTYIPGTTAPEPLLAPHVLQLNASGTKIFDGTTMTNQSGLVNWNADTLYLQNGAALVNQSLWDAKSDNTLLNNGGATSTFNNSGTFRKSAGAGTTAIGGISFVNSGTIDAQTGTVNFSGNNATFNAGSQFTGAGSTVVSSNATFNGAFTSSNLWLTGGTLSGNAAQVNGNLNYSGGTLKGNWEIAGGQSLWVKDGGTKILAAGALTNNGNVRWQTAGILYMQDGSSITNNALVDFQAGTTIFNNGGTLSSFTNNGTGTLQVASGQTTTMGTVAFTNNGGTLDVGATGFLSYSGGNARFNGGTSFTGAGTNQVVGNATFVDNFNSQNLRLAGGAYTGGDGTPASKAAISGTVDFAGGVFSGNWELGSGQTLKGSTGTGKFLSGANFTNKGSVLWQSADILYLQTGSTFDNQGSFNMNTGTTLFNNGGALSTFTNSGSIGVAAGQAGNFGTFQFVNNGGSIDVGTGGSLNFSGGNVRFNAGTSFTGAGTSQISSNATFVDNFSAQNLRLTGGTYTGGDGTPASKAVIAGTVDYAGGTFTGNWELGSGQVINGRTGSGKFLSAANFTNKGSFLWQNTDTLYLQNGTTFDNQGLFNLTASATLYNNGGATPTFTNTGTFSVDPGQAGYVSSFHFVNNGGTITAGAGGSLNFAGANATFNAGTQFTGAGVSMVTAGAGFNGGFSATNLSLRGGAFAGSGAVMAGTGEFSGGNMTGTWTVANGATLNGVTGAGKFFDAITMLNQGTINWQTTDVWYFQSGASFTNQGTLALQADATIYFNGGQSTSFVNTGLITKTAGTGSSIFTNSLGFDNQGIVDVSTGTIVLPDNFTNKGTLKGTGRFQTNSLTNTGHVAPGSSAGILTLAGNYAQSAGGFIDIELGGTTPGTQHDQLSVTGSVNLTGTTLKGKRINGFVPTAGNQFTILQSVGAITGQFAQGAAVAFDGWGFSIAYNPNSVVLTALGPVPDLGVTKSHLGNFAQGQIGAKYTVVVTNVGTIDKPAGSLVSLVDTAPAGLTVMTMSGTGWSCGVLATCTRTDLLGAGQSYPPVTVFVAVAANATSPQTNSVTVSSAALDGDPGNDTATDPTTIVAGTPGSLTVSRSGSGTGTLSSLEGGINCGASCTHGYVVGSNIMLFATPAGSSVFTGWLGGGCTGTGVCVTTITGASSVSATFALASIGTHILDIDANNQYEPLTDGLMVLRYLFGEPGSAVILNAIGTSPGRSDSGQIVGYLTDIRPYLDADGNGVVDALTDGLLILRNLLGLTGPALTEGAVGPGATRILPADIQGYLTTLKQ